MQRSFASVLSVLFHPLLLPTYAVALIMLLAPHFFAHLSSVNFNLSIIIVFIFTFIFPVVSILIMRGLDVISSFEMQDAKERIFPIIAIGSFYIWMYFFFKPTYRQTMASTLVSNMLLGAIIAIFFSFIINLFKKISLHAMGMGSLVAIAFSLISISAYDIRFLLMGIIVLAGMVGTARLILKAHTQDEIWIGYLIGFLSQYASLIVVPRVLAFFS